MSNEHVASITSPRSLRRQAEERWRTKHGHDCSVLSRRGPAVYELEVHQIELELQNEHLLRRPVGIDRGPPRPLPRTSTTSRRWAPVTLDIPIASSLRGQSRRGDDAGLGTGKVAGDADGRLRRASVGATPSSVRLQRIEEGGKLLAKPLSSAATTAPREFFARLEMHPSLNSPPRRWRPLPDCDRGRQQACTTPRTCSWPERAAVPLPRRKRAAPTTSTLLIPPA